MPWRQAISLLSPGFHKKQAYHIADVAILPFKLERPEQNIQFCIMCILICCTERHVLTISTKLHFFAWAVHLTWLHLVVAIPCKDPSNLLSVSFSALPCISYNFWTLLDLVPLKEAMYIALCILLLACCSLHVVSCMLFLVQKVSLLIDILLCYRLVWQQTRHMQESWRPSCLQARVSQTCTPGAHTTSSSCVS